MFEGLLKYGMDRWDAVADHVGTKTSQRCRAHYTQCFLDGSHNAPMPDTSRLVCASPPPCTSGNTLRATPREIYRDRAAPVMQRCTDSNTALGVLRSQPQRRPRPQRRCATAYLQRGQLVDVVCVSVSQGAHGRLGAARREGDEKQND
jgi:hypothetical protein